MRTLRIWNCQVAPGKRLAFPNQFIFNPNYRSRRSKVGFARFRPLGGLRRLGLPWCRLRFCQNVSQGGYFKFYANSQRAHIFLDKNIAFYCECCNALHLIGVRTLSSCFGAPS